MYLEAMTGGLGAGSGLAERSPSTIIPLCVLLGLCRRFGMEEECHNIIRFRNRSYTDSYPSRPKEAILGMLSVFCVLGTLGNALVLYVYVRKKNKIASTIFIICLAATDFVTSSIIMPFTMTMESLDYFIVYDALCKVYFFLITCNVPFATFIMVAIAIDRYLCICKPHCHLLDSRRSQIGIIFLIFVSAMFGVLTALFHGVYLTEEFDIEKNDTETMAAIRQNIMTQFDLDNFTELCTNSTNPHCEEEARNVTLSAVDTMASAQITECMLSEEKVVVYTGQCRFNQIIFSTFFRKTYQKVYASMFLICFIVVFLLYIAIYRSVIVRRTRRLRARQKTNVRLLRDVSVTDTHTTTVAEAAAAAGSGSGSGSGSGGHVQNGFEMTELTHESRKAMLENDSGLKEKYLLANIRTALMLFVVTLVFILAFLPSWLMAHGVVKFHALVFFSYFAYNVSNPIIYAFMNPIFRKELHDVLRCMGVRQSRASFSK
ncbi:uncharacterized protein LOC143287200 [Babylonia areolata]|uniref:uncharacterized protein LOC143287200 n=1 Tax=Babylonia areolata TaxID=304850 RepID=UPI003FD1373C